MSKLSPDDETQIVNTATTTHPAHVAIVDEAERRKRLYRAIADCLATMGGALSRLAAVIREIA